MSSQAWADLKEFGNHYKEAAGVATIAATAIPLAGLQWEDWVPAYPPGTPVMASVIAAVWVLSRFFLYRRLPAADFQRPLRWHQWCAILAFAIYLPLLFACTGKVVSAPYVRSPLLTQAANDAVSNKKATAEDASSLIGYFGPTDDEQDDIWRYRWAVKAILLFSFTTLFAAIAGFFALHVLKHMAEARAPGP